jgi:hypothetical protein
MIILVGILTAVVFLVLWRGGVIQDLGRRHAGTSDPTPTAPPDLTSRPDPVPEERRLEVFAEFIRSLPDDDADGPPAPAP